MSEFDFGPGLRMEERIDAAESEAITERWEFGRWMLTHVPEGGKKLPDGFLDGLAKATGKNERELQRRRQFAEACPDRETVASVLTEWGSWDRIINEALPTEPRERPNPAPIEPAEGTYSVLYADPPWRYEQPGGQTPELRSVENHYPTMTVEEIASLSVPAADDAVLFMWGTNPLLREALEVMDAWGFEYRTNVCWVKDRFGMGYYVRGQHELLLLGRRGELPVPEPSNRPASVLSAPRGKHSEKPEAAYELIEGLYPAFSKVELFARRPRSGWASWGNQLAEAA